MPAQSFQRPKRFKRRPRSRKRMPFSSKQVKAIKKLSVAAQDMKYEDDSISTTDLLKSTSYYMSIEALNIAQGSAYNQRLGSRIDVKDLTFYTTLNLPNPMTSLAHYAVRMLIVQYPEGKTTAINTSFASLAPAEPLPTLANTDGTKYKILHDKTVIVAPFAPHKVFKHRVLAKDLEIKAVEYDLGLNVLEILKGDVVMYITPDVNATIAGGELQAETRWKLRYFG